ncbi:hypothetical protein [Streptomyces sp. TN58]|nr:hypothetical protein [Streptomyces sp. TN58]
MAYQHLAASTSTRVVAYGGAMVVAAGVWAGMAVPAAAADSDLPE